MESRYPILRTSAIIKISASTVLSNKITLAEDSVLMGKIKSGDEKDMWTFPWHEMEKGESYYKSFFSGLWRDIRFTCTNVNMIDRENPFAVSNDVFPNEHYITLFHRAEYDNGVLSGLRNKDRYQLFELMPWRLVQQVAEQKPLEINPHKTPYPLSPSIEYLLKNKYNPFNLGDS